MKYKLIIADDEEIECKSLRIMINKEFNDIEIVAVAKNGIELINYIEKYEPDFAIVDITMPGINGLEAIKLLSDKGINIHYIINTAYSDFEYVQQSVDLKVDTYILKSQKRVDTINRINYVCKCIDKERAKKESHIQVRTAFKKMIPIVESDIMLSIISNIENENSLDSWCEMNSKHFCSGFIFTLVPNNNHNSFFNLNGKHNMLDELHERLDDFCDFLIHVNKNYLNIFAISTKDVSNNWKDDVVALTVKQVKLITGLKLRIGVGGIKEDLSSKYDSYLESIDVLNGKINLSIVNNIRNDSLKDMSLMIFNDLLSNENIENTLDILNNDLLKIGDYRLIKEFIMIYINTNSFNYHIKRTTNDFNNEFLEINEKDIYKTKMIEMLLELNGLLDKNGEKNNVYVSKALKYIDNNYHNSISLDEIAEDIGVSQFYLSRLFKEEFNQKFIDYLTQVRLNEAKRLALNSNITIKEICAKVGYANSAYFCRLFKKNTNYTFGEYRELMKDIKF